MLTSPLTVLSIRYPTVDYVTSHSQMLNRIQCSLQTHSKNLNNYEEDDDDIEIDHSTVCNNLICEMRERDIADSLNGLKNRKSLGLDNVLNEYLKTKTASEYIHVY